MKPRKLSRGESHEHVLRALSAFEPMSVREYAENFGIDNKAAFERMRRMWDAKLLHVAEYRRQRSGPPTPAYAIGNLPDAERPKPVAVSEKVAKYQASEKGKATTAKCRKRQRAKHKRRMESDLAYAEAKRAYQRLWSQKKHGHKPRRRLVEVEKFDPILAALMGRAPKKGKRNGSEDQKAAPGREGA